jgi:glycosyltransferase involved in cell wall biosynthesis
MRYWKMKSLSNDPKVGIVIATFDQTACLQSLIASLKTQTWRNFTALVSHDGPASEEVKQAYKAAAGNDPRFIFQESPERKNQFGHERRYAGFEQLIASGCDHLCTTNGDCWYTPNYFESMLYQLQKDSVSLAYCNMIHSHKLWQPLRTEMARGKIDVGCWMAHKDLVSSVTWTDFTFAGDWSFIHKMHKSCEGKHSKVDAYLYVHN